MTISITQAPILPLRPRPIIIIGAGGIVRDAHLPAYRKFGFKVAGIFDIVESRSRSLAEACAIQSVFRSLEEAVKGAPEGAVFDIAVPASNILEVLPRLREASGVLIEKPMGENLAQARAIRDVCHRKQFIAAINFQLRYAPYVLAARSLIEQGHIGEVHAIDVRVTVFTPWHLFTYLESIPRVEILYHSVHYLDMIRSFLGEPNGVYAKTVKHPKVAKLASTRSSIILDYGNTLQINITTNHGHDFGPKHQESYIKWEGTRGAIKVRLGLLLNYPKGEPDQFEYCLLQEGKDAEWVNVPLEGSWFPDAFIGTMSSLMRFMDKSCEELPTSVDDAFKTMALVEAAYKSNESGATPISF